MHSSKCTGGARREVLSLCSLCMCEEVMETMGWLFGWSSPCTYVCTHAQCNNIHGLWLTQLFTDSVVNVKYVLYLAGFFAITVMGVDLTVCILCVYGTLLILGNNVGLCFATSDTPPCVIRASMR